MDLRICKLFLLQVLRKWFNPFLHYFFKAKIILNFLRIKLLQMLDHQKYFLNFMLLRKRLLGRTNFNFIKADKWLILGFLQLCNEFLDSLIHLKNNHKFFLEQLGFFNLFDILSYRDLDISFKRFELVSYLPLYGCQVLDDDAK